MALKRKPFPAKTATPTRKGPLDEAVAQMESGNYSAAATVLKPFLEQEPSNEEARHLFAQLHLKLGSLLAAQSSFESLAREAIAQKDFKKAETLLREYLAAASRYVPFIELLGQVCEGAGNPEGAIAEYGKAASILLEFPDPDDHARAASLFEKVKQLAPASPVVRDLAIAIAAASRGAPPAQDAQAAPVQPIAAQGGTDGGARVLEPLARAPASGSSGQAYTLPDPPSPAVGLPVELVPLDSVAPSSHQQTLVPGAAESASVVSLQTTASRDGAHSGEIVVTVVAAPLQELPSDPLTQAAADVGAATIGGPSTDELEASEHRSTNGALPVHRAADPIQASESVPTETGDLLAAQAVRSLEPAPSRPHRLSSGLISQRSTPFTQARSSARHRRKPTGLQPLKASDLEKRTAHIEGGNGPSIDRSPGSKTARWNSYPTGQEIPIPEDPADGQAGAHEEPSLTLVSPPQEITEPSFELQHPESDSSFLSRGQAPQLEMELPETASRVQGQQDWMELGLDRPVHSTPAQSTPSVAPNVAPMETSVTIHVHPAPVIVGGPVASAEQSVPAEPSSQEEGPATTVGEVLRDEPRSEPPSVYVEPLAPVPPVELKAPAVSESQPDRSQGWVPVTHAPPREFSSPDVFPSSIPEQEVHAPADGSPSVIEGTGTTGTPPADAAEPGPVTQFDGENKSEERRRRSMDEESVRPSAPARRGNRRRWFRAGLASLRQTTAVATRKVVRATLLLMSLGAGVPLLLLIGVVMMWFGLEQKPNAAFMQLTQAPPRPFEEPTRNGYFMLLGFGASETVDPIKAGYTKWKTTETDQSRRCFESRPEWRSAARFRSETRALALWYQTSEPVEVFQRERAQVQKWAGQHSVLMTRYRQWLTMPFEDRGYGRFATPNCEQILVAHRLYVAEGFARRDMNGAERLELDLRAWRNVLARAKTMSTKLLAAQAIKEDVAVIAALAARSRSDGAHLSRLAHVVRPFDQVERSLRWPIQNELLLEMKRMEAAMKDLGSFAHPVLASVLGWLPVPKQRALNAHAEYYEALIRTPEPNAQSTPDSYHFTRTPAQSPLDYLVNPVDNLLVEEEQEPWQHQAALLNDTDTRLRQLVGKKTFHHKTGTVLTSESDPPPPSESVHLVSSDPNL